MRDPRWSFGTIEGRRRIGKTKLVQRAFEILAAEHPDAKTPLLVRLAGDSPQSLAHRFRADAALLGHGGLLPESPPPYEPAGLARDIGRLCERGIVVVLDEFQECDREPLDALPSLLQEEVDRLHEAGAPGTLLLLGSMQSRMARLLRDAREPLYGRTTFRSIRLDPWSLRTVFEVCGDLGVTDPGCLLTLWTLFGGVPKYWRHCWEAELGARGDGWSSWAQDVCWTLFLSTSAPLGEEGDVLLGPEIRPEARAVLQAVAYSGPLSADRVAAAVPGLADPKRELRTLSEGLGLVREETPFGAGAGSGRSRFVVADPFLRAWLRVLRPARDAARFRTDEVVREALVRRLETLEGHAFEDMIHRAIVEASRAGADFPVSAAPLRYERRSRPGRRGVEIDVIAWEDEGRQVLFGSCKRSARDHDEESLKGFGDAIETFLKAEGDRFRAWGQEKVLFSPHFSRTARTRLEGQGFVCRDLEDYRGFLSDTSNGDLGPPFPAPLTPPAP